MRIAPSELVRALKALGRLPRRFSISVYLPRPRKPGPEYKTYKYSLVGLTDGSRTVTVLYETLRHLLERLDDPEVTIEILEVELRITYQVGEASLCFVDEKFDDVPVVDLRKIAHVVPV